MKSDVPELRLDWAGGAPAALRRLYAEGRKTYLADAPEDVAVADVVVAGRAALRFRPAERRIAQRVLYFHGGGWIVGSPTTHRTLCACLARQMGAEVTSVSYGLAPEHAFPQQATDASAALRALLDAGEGDVILAGDSAGAAMALWAEAGVTDAEAARIAWVISFYGCFGLRDSASLRALGPDVPGLSIPEIAGMYARLGPAFPLDLRPSFRGKGAPLAMFVAGQDPLADDSRMLADWALGQGRAVEIFEAAEATHGCLHMAGRDPVTADWMAQTISLGARLAG